MYLLDVLSLQWELCYCAHLSIIGYSTKELQLEVKPPWICIEQPPQAAGQVLEEKNSPKCKRDNLTLEDVECSEYNLQCDDVSVYEGVYVFLIRYV